MNWRLHKPSICITVCMCSFVPRLPKVWVHRVLRSLLPWSLSRKQGGLACREVPARNRTQFVWFEQSDTNLTLLTANYTMVGGRVQFQALPVTGVVLRSLPAAYKTAEYYATHAAPLVTVGCNVFFNVKREFAFFCTLASRGFPFTTPPPYCV